MVTSLPAAGLPTPDTIFRASTASIPAMIDTAAPKDGISPSSPGTVPRMSLRLGVFPGTNTAICPFIPDIPPWTSGIPSSSAASESTSLDSMLSRQSTMTSQPSNMR